LILLEDLKVKRKLAKLCLVAFSAIIFILFLTVGLFIIQGFGLWGFNLDSEILERLALAVISEVAGIVGIVYFSYFKNPS
jgi:hypothetical protein